MIVFDLECRSAGHRFEGWFASSDAFAEQQERGLVSCPHCGSVDIAKAVMAPNVGRKGNQAGAPAKLPVAGGNLPPEAREMLVKLATIQAEALSGSRWVGKGFVEEARKMHYGEADTGTIHGEATVDEAKELLSEGIPLVPLPFPVAPPDELN